VVDITSGTLAYAVCCQIIFFLAGNSYNGKDLLSSVFSGKGGAGGDTVRTTAPPPVKM
jgi:hypothetical protein